MPEKSMLNKIHFILFCSQISVKHNFRIQDVQSVIDTLTPLNGAKQFLDQLRADHQLLILSDTFQQFAVPMMRQLGWPTIFCHELVIDEGGRIGDYKLPKADHKRETVKRLHELNFKVVAAGDSYNDTSMLAEAEQGILFCPPQKVTDEFPQFPVAKSYTELRAEIDLAISEMPIA